MSDKLVNDDTVLHDVKPCFHPTQRAPRTQRDGCNARIDAAAVVAFWPLRRLRRLRPYTLRTFLAFTALVAYLLAYLSCAARVSWVENVRKGDASVALHPFR